MTLSRNSNLKVLVVASEISPLAGTGGLAEVAGSLPVALKEIGCTVSVAMPAYRQVLADPNQWETALAHLPVEWTGLTADILVGELAPGLPAYMVRRDQYFDREGLYGDRLGGYGDNAERFIFFSRSIPILCRELNFIPDVILANDWQTGLVMALLDLGALPRTAGAFTIHNQSFLGLMPRDQAGLLGLPERYLTMHGLEYHGQLSLLKAGVAFADAIVTVSPSFAREIQTPEGGYGLDGLMRTVNGRLSGILNGVDYHTWNPASDPILISRYSPDDLSGKALCKRDLLTRFGLGPQWADKPLVGMVSRLSAQKGLGLLDEAAEQMFKMDFGLVILGSGEKPFEDLAQSLAMRYPDRVGLQIGFDPKMAHRIMAGSDMILMPSLFEPCGLAQMYGLKYGAVPIVRAVGGLNDTVFDPEHGAEPGTGFKFGPFQPRALVRALRRALELYSSPDRWKDMMIAGMNQDFSWNRSARGYIEVFEKAMKHRRDVWS